jgi:hypothetical protein
VDWSSTETGRGKGSSVPVDRSLATRYAVIDGKIARITTFRTEHEALETAGLRGGLRPPRRTTFRFSTRGPVP